MRHRRTLDDTFLMHVIDTGTWERMYKLGYREPRFPVPAIPLQVVYPYNGAGCLSLPFNGIGYSHMIYIDDVSDPYDPVMVCAWDFYNGPNHIGKHGEYIRI